MGIQVNSGKFRFFYNSGKFRQIKERSGQFRYILATPHTAGPTSRSQGGPQVPGAKEPPGARVSPKPVRGQGPQPSPQALNLTLSSHLDSLQCSL